ncbi:hypothetical protein IV73_GL001050 [Weissella kandleri]|uniref:Single-stranded DNA-binding protein n=1 Tax=Weissella kandleri TaxID=1616 RepID=A0A0R2JFZ7_9LACO|nr:single-stranded DNA-binding protein [Weissella kandleri]KRN74774.1 hypothetical protein IV73_GL001050 [Weissella kandleri]
MQMMMANGNLVRSVKLMENRGSHKNTTMVYFDIAVGRYSKGQKKTDFIHLVAYENIAKNLVEYANKPGTKLGIKFEMRSSNYINKEGKKVYTTQNLVKELEFLGRKVSNNSTDSNGVISDKSIPVTTMDEEYPMLNEDEYDVVGEDY